MKILIVIGCLLSNPLDESVASVIAAHEAALRAICSVEAHVVVTAKIKGERDSEMATVDWYRSGLRERFVERVSSLANSAGDRFSADSVLRQYGYDDTSVRTLFTEESDERADLDKELMPGDPAYANTKCAIVPRDPAGGVRPLMAWLRLAVTPLHSLEQLVQTAKTVTASESEEAAHLELDGTPVGNVRLTFDKKRGFLLVRTEYRVHADDAEPASVAQIEEFHEEEGVWFPKRVVHSNSGGELDVAVRELRLNRELDPTQLAIRFPNGVRVDEPSKGLIHRWGEGDAPSKSFSSLDDFIKSELSRSRVTRRVSSRDWILVANVVGIILIVAATLARQWVGRRSSRSASISRSSGL